MDEFIFTQFSCAKYGVLDLIIEYTVTQEFQIAIKELSISQDDANTGNDTKQWWIAIVIIVVVLAGFGIFALVSTIKRKNG